LPGNWAKRFGGLIALGRLPALEEVAWRLLVTGDAGFIGIGSLRVSVLQFWVSRLEGTVFRRSFWCGIATSTFSRVTPGWPNATCTVRYLVGLAACLGMQRAPDKPGLIRYISLTPPVRTVRVPLVLCAADAIFPDTCTSSPTGLAHLLDSAFCLTVGHADATDQLMIVQRRIQLQQHALRCA